MKSSYHVNGMINFQCTFSDFSFDLPNPACIRQYISPPVQPTISFVQSRGCFWYPLTDLLWGTFVTADFQVATFLNRFLCTTNNYVKMGYWELFQKLSSFWKRNFKCVSFRRCNYWSCFILIRSMMDNIISGYYANIALIFFLIYVFCRHILHLPI